MAVLIPAVGTCSFETTGERCLVLANLSRKQLYAAATRGTQRLVMGVGEGGGFGVRLGT